MIKHRPSNKLFFCLGVFATGLLANPSSILAWWPFSHNYIISGNVPSEVSAMQPYANLPDLWPSNVNTGDVCRQVTEAFCWSHSTIRKCRVLNCCPIAPSPYATENPEKVNLDMLDLYEKLSTNHKSEEMLATARGFAVHNGADSVVHFMFFLGGVSDEDILECGLRWFDDHANKEEWAEYLLYAESIDYPNQPWSDDAHQMTAMGHAGIICLAQKAFRKNARNVVEAGCGLPTGITVETSIAIQNRIDAQASQLSSMTYTVLRFEALQRLANAYADWWGGEEGVYDRRDEAQAAAVAEYQATVPTCTPPGG
jgi:hypothetical protein